MFNQTLFCIGNHTITLCGLLAFIGILVFSWIFARWLRSLIQKLGQDQQQQSSVNSIGRLVFYVVISIGVLSALHSIGLDLSTFTVVAGALSVGVGFGLQTIVNNFISGIILLSEKNIRVGDRIEIDGAGPGTVREMSVRTTKIELNDQKIMIIPNTDLISKKVILRTKNS